jgi:hypothetical protein
MSDKKELYEKINETLGEITFEENNTSLRCNLLNMVIPIVHEYKTTKNIFDFLVVCDERNNTQEDINNHELHLDVYTKENKEDTFNLVHFYMCPTRHVCGYVDTSE